MLTWFRKKTKLIMIIVAVVFVASMFYGLGMAGFKNLSTGSSRDIARINGEILSPLRFREILNRIIASLGKEVSPRDLAFVQSLALNQAIDFTLMLQKARKSVSVGQGEIDQAINNVMQTNKLSSEKELNEALKRVGLSSGDFKNLLKEEMLVSKLSKKIKDDVVLTPEDKKEIRVSHILIRAQKDDDKLARQQAQELLARLKNGEDFAGLAKKYSMDPGSAASGGDLGYFSAGRMVAPFEKAAFALKVGETSDIVKTDFGYHIIRVDDIRLRKIEGGGGDVEAALLKEKQDRAFAQWIADLKKDAKVEIISPSLRASDYRFRGDLQKAVDEYKLAIANDPSNYMLHVFLADTYASLGSSELALLEYKEAARLESADPAIHLILADAYQKNKDHDLALEEYKKASIIAGDNKALHESLLKEFKSKKLYSLVAREEQEIKRLERKERFEKELQKATP